MTLQNNINDKSNIRAAARKSILRKKDESMVTQLLAKHPYHIEFLNMYTKMQNGIELSGFERLQLELTYQAHRELVNEEQTNPAVANEQFGRLEQITRDIKPADGIMNEFSNQLKRNVPLNKDQEYVLRSWEEMYATV